MNEITEKVLSMLDGVKQIGENRFKAKCPAHVDNDPSFFVTEIDNGKILMHCFSGCSKQAIVDALGITLSDLMGPLTHHRYSPRGYDQRPCHKPLKLDPPKGESYYRTVLDIAESDAYKGAQSSSKGMEIIQEAKDYFNAKKQPLKKSKNLLDYESKRQAYRKRLGF